MFTTEDLLEALPVAVYTTDKDGSLTFFNSAASRMWGRSPDLHTTRWWGSWRLYFGDGRPMAFDESPMAMSLGEGRAIRGVETIGERPDGTRVPFVPHPTLLRDSAGAVTGAINVLVDISEHKKSEVESARLAAIVESSDDAIISKTLTGQVTSWNAAAERIFGYKAAEMIGQPITRLIPSELLVEEEQIIAKLIRGERIEHFDTIRVRKDGRRINISLTVSPLRDRAGKVVGASKVARDVTERKRDEELQDLLFGELNHRVKNTLATIQAIATQSLSRAASSDEFVASFNGRVQALARAHDLLVMTRMNGASVAEVIREQVLFGAADNRIATAGPDVVLNTRLAVHLGLVLHELATNARKHGGLSRPGGRLDIAWDVDESGGEPRLKLTWRERGGPVAVTPGSNGFGLTLIKRTLESNGGSAELRFESDGVACDITLPIADDLHDANVEAAVPGQSAHRLDGRVEPKPPAGRILLVEDEPLVAMDMHWTLDQEGFEVIGPAATVESAREMIARGGFDVALLDANLAGKPVEDIARALDAAGIPFAFATGYGTTGLPLSFRSAPVLTKPFTREQLLGMARRLLDLCKEAEPPTIAARH